MGMTKTISLTDWYKKIAKIADDVKKNGTVYIVTRQKKEVFKVKRIEGSEKMI